MEASNPPPKSDVVILLDDDDPDTEVIEIVEKSANSKCINYSCKSGVDLLTAPSVCLSYYRIKKPGNGSREVCTECYTLAFAAYQDRIAALKASLPMANNDHPVRHDVVKIDDSDEEIDEIDIDPANAAFIGANIDRVLAATLAKFDLPEIIRREAQYVASHAATIKQSIEDIGETIKTTRVQLDTIQMELYSHFRVETFEASVISIVDDHSLNSHPLIRTESINTQPLLRPAPPAPPSDLPTVGPSPAPVASPDQIVYISRESNTGNWIRARIKAVLPIGASHEGSAPLTAPLYHVLELKQHKERHVSGKNVALTEPSKHRLEIGTRVIAKFIMTRAEPTNARLIPFYPGLVAEPPVLLNRYRYLIFFDIGYAHYVDYQSVYQIFEASAHAWLDTPLNSQAFIKRYLQRLDRPMVKVGVGQALRVEYNDKWQPCTVREVDNSLVLVAFDQLERTEWIYRGSPRLSPMYKEEQNATKRHTGGRTANRNQGGSIVQYAEIEDYGGVAVRPARAVARKSTARPETVTVTKKVTTAAAAATTTSSAVNIPFLPPQASGGMGGGAGGGEPASKIMYFTPRDQVITQRVYRSHTCSAMCKEYVRYNLNKLKGHNPLAKPLLCGWARITLKVKSRKDIVYKAPCGRILRSMAEVHRYLRMTRSEMTVDLFDFNQMVRCLAEFNVDCTSEPKDLSNGLEEVPVPVINGVDNRLLDFCQYETRRVPTDGVQMNLDEEFLCACDCQDDCRDKTRCQCWRLTLEGAKYMGRNVDPNAIGYVYRRLHEQVLTGIYECNAKCKCSKTCLNRVVQNPMSVKLQVFKTHNRGWGIRCVNDLPQGTFICIYAGTIHTEQDANKDGVEQGDEYFAELDYIENCEKYKEDYEAEAMETDSEEDEEDEEEINNEGTISSNNNRRRGSGIKDRDFVPGCFATGEIRTDKENTMRLRRRAKDEGNESDAKSAKKDAVTDTVAAMIETVTISDDEDELKEVLSFNPKSGWDLDKNKATQPSVRSFFGEDEPYIMDTKNAGNIGRFLNHSCSPNVFVQNVFVDTHDLRFPWVAFFCSQFIRAGTELTWNYNYDIGSVPGRVMYCQCGSLECKGRLL